MKITQNFIRGLAHGGQHKPADPPRESLQQARLGRNLSRLDGHVAWRSPLQHAVTKLAGLITPARLLTAGTSLLEHPINEDSLKDHVRAILGMEHNASRIDPDLAPYLDELSKNSSLWLAQPVTRSSFTLLCVLYTAYQAGPSGYGPLKRTAFTDWLNKQLDSASIRDDLIPPEYFSAIQVVDDENGCTVWCGRDRATSVEVRAMRRLHLQGENLRDANLQGADLQRADLQGAKLQGAKLQGAKLQVADLRYADLQGADLRDANLQLAKLRYADLRYATLQGATLQGADLQGADLRGANLRGANLQGADLLVTPDMGVKIVFEHCHLIGAKLDIPLEKTVAQDQLQQEVRTQIMRLVEQGTDQDSWFDLRFNHRNNAGRSVLINIANLDDSCSRQKQALMRAIVAELDFARKISPDGMAGLIPSLGDVLFQDPEYLKGYDDFAIWLLAGLLGDGSTLIDATLGDTALKALGDHAESLLHEKGLQAIEGYSVAIYQLLYAMRQRAAVAPSPETRQRWTAQGEALHKQYCETLEGAIPSLMNEHSIYRHERDAILMDDDAFPLVSADGLHCGIMSDAGFRQLILLEEPMPNEGTASWVQLPVASRASEADNFPTYASARGMRGDPDGTVLKHFPLLYTARQRAEAGLRLREPLSLAGLQGADLDLFEEALKKATSMVKLVSSDDQQRLDGIFNVNMDLPPPERTDEPVRLTSEHFDVLRQKWQAGNDKHLAFRLLCLGALYTRYSSSHIFGTDDNSPTALRHYAEALQRKALELDPSLITSTVFGNWMDRLKGNAFSCTAILYNLQLPVVKALAQESPDYQNVLDEVIPLVWR